MCSEVNKFLQTAGFIYSQFDILYSVLVELLKAVEAQLFSNQSISYFCLVYCERIFLGRGNVRSCASLFNLNLKRPRILVEVLSVVIYWLVQCVVIFTFEVVVQKGQRYLTDWFYLWVMKYEAPIHNLI